jgi:hypothetical protein
MITWVGGLTSTATTAISTVGVQYYNIPPNISKIKDNTISIGQLKYTPTEVKTRREWDLINTLPYTSDIPNYYFIYNGQLGIFPIPSTTGNILSFNYKTRVSDLSFTDWTQGTITTFTAGSINVVGGGTPAWTTGIGVPINTDITQFNLFIRLDPPKGDGIWYQIAQINSDTTLTLVNPVITTATTGTTYTIGQIPLLNEDFHDMLVYGALMTYFSSIVQDENKFKNFEMLYKERLELLAEYAGTKSVSVDLGTEPQMINPNLFLYNN